MDKQTNTNVQTDKHKRTDICENKQRNKSTNRQMEVQLFAASNIFINFLYNFMTMHIFEWSVLLKCNYVIKD